MPSPEAVKEHLGRIQEQGYTIVENAIEPELLGAIASELERLEKTPGIGPGKNLF